MYELKKRQCILIDLVVLHSNFVFISYNVVLSTSLRQVASTGWGNEDKQSTYYNANTALFPSSALSMPMYAETHWVKHRDYAWRVYAQVIN